MIRIITGDCREAMKTLPDESVHCVVTSPPYWGLRDYGIAGQLGMERSLGEFLEVMVDVFREVRRVLRKDGTLWLNLGDSYAASVNGRSAADTKLLGEDDRTFRDKPFSTIGPVYVAEGQVPDNKNRKARVGQSGNKGSDAADFGGRIKSGGLIKPKDLCGIPWRVAFALQEDGWWLRQDIIWSKPNPMPESVTDRCTKAHEYLFLLAKSERYYFDQEAISEESGGWNGSKFDDPRDLEIRPTTGRDPRNMNTPTGWDTGPGSHGKFHRDGRQKGPRFGTPGGKAEIEYGSPVSGKEYIANGRRNKRSVWEVTTQPFSEAHFATFPPALIEPCIKAGTSEKGCCSKCGALWKREIGRDEQPEAYPDRKYDRNDPLFATKRNLGGRYQAQLNANPMMTLGWSPTCKCDAAVVPCTVLDPFGGAGTTGLVADRLGREAVLIELNPEYVALAERRIKGDAPLFTKVEVNALSGTMARQD